MVRRFLPAAALVAGMVCLVLLGLVSCTDEGESTRPGEGQVAGDEGTPEKLDGGGDATSDIVTDPGAPFLPGVVAVYQVLPSTGPTTGSTIVSIAGIGFHEGAKVLFGGNEAKVVKFVDPSRLAAESPAGVAGPATITVRNLDGTKGEFANGFLYYDLSGDEAPPPALLEAIPGQGPSGGGTAVLLRGDDFQVGAVVFVDWRVVGSAQVTSKEWISFITPSLKVGAIDLAVSNPDGLSDVLEKGFVAWQAGEETVPAPHVVKVHPSAGSVYGGLEVTVTGAGLAEKSTLILGGKPMDTWKIVSPQEGRFVTPPHAPGLLDLSVTNADGQSSTYKNAFLYFTDPPTLFSLEPDHGPLAGGNQVAISGAYFAQGMQVTIGGKPCTGVAVIAADGVGTKAGTATCTVPPGDVPGPVSVVAKNPDGLVGVLPKGYTYTDIQPPVVDEVVPGTGSVEGGTVVLVLGAHFQEASKVFFGKSPAQMVEAKVVAGSETAMGVELPPASAAGLVDVAVKTPGLPDATLAGGFEYTQPGPPLLTGISPAEGPVQGGIVVAVSGADLRPETAIWFGAKEAAPVVATGPGGMAVKLPAAVSAGVVDVTAKTPGFDDSVLKAAFTYTEPGPPKVKAVVPAKGPANGGIIVVVQGENLRPESQVLFAEEKAVSVYALGPDGMGVVLPAAAKPGLADVTLHTPGYEDTLLAGGFEYVAPEVVSSEVMALAQVQPSTGPTTGGGWVVLKGLNLPLAAKVFFGGKAAPKVVHVSGTMLTARVPPAAAAGAVDVVVSDPASLTEAKLSGGYVYYAAEDALHPAPKLLWVKPALGPSTGGTLALLHGADIQDGAIVFVAGKPGADPKVSDAEHATFVTPPGAPGAASVMLVNPDGAWAELTGAFVYTVPGPTSVALSSVVPVQGSTAGGTLVTLSGNGFKPGTLAFLDGALMDGKLKSAASLTFVTKPHPPGLVDVAVTAPDGSTAVLKDAYNFIHQTPFVAAVAPDYGPPAGGTDVVISGQGFHPQAAVAFGEADAVVLAATENVITAKTPAGKLGKVDVTVTNPDFLSYTLNEAFQYSEVVPGDAVQIHAVVPSFGPVAGGTSSTIAGAGFGPGASVIVGTEVSTGAKILSATSLYAAMPGGPVGPKDVKVVVPEVGSATAHNAFFHYDPSSGGPFPAISAVEPHIGPTSGGTIARIDVVPADPKSLVFAGGIPAKVLGADGKAHVVVEMPAHPPGPVDVTLMLPDGKPDTLAGAFTYYTPGPDVVPPLLTAVDPTSGTTLGGDAVAFTGAGLVSGTLAFLGYHPVTKVAVPDPNHLTGTTPAHDAGLVDAAVTRPDGFSARLKAAFAYGAPPPVPETVFPEVGHVDGGLTVVVAGTGFAPGAKVFFGEAESPKVLVVAPTVLTAVTPAVPEAGLVDVEVMNMDGQSGVAAGAFTFGDEDFESPPPTILKLVPNHGPYAGTTVLAAWGKDFQQGAKVLFGGVPAEIHLVDADLVTLTTPSGFVGPVDVTVLNPDGQAHSLPAGFSYIVTTAQKPKLFGVTPPGGPEKGGTPVVLTGSSLSGGGIGFVGYRPLSSWTVLNSAIATGTTVKGTPGPADVVATNGDGQSATLKQGYTFVGAPFIDSFDPSVGAVAGGKVVHIAGKNFSSSAKVTFAGKPVQSLEVLGSLVIKVQTPPGDPGPAQVRVTNPDGQTHVAKDPYLYVLPPLVQSVFPKKGSAAGGTPVILKGKDLLPGASVRFGESDATSVVFVDPGTLTMVAPAGKAGTFVDVTLQNPDGQSAILYKAYQYVDPAQIGPPPAAVGLTPPTGPTTGGTWGLLAGNGLQQGAQVILGTTPVSVFDVLDAKSGRYVSAPAGHAGTVDVTVVNPDGGFGVLPEGFTYTDPKTLDDPPKVTALTPASGPTKGGTKVAISGTELSAKAVVFFDTLPSPQVTEQAPDIVVTTPAHTPGTVDVVVTDEEGQTTHVEGAYTFVPPPMVASIEPTSGPSAGGTFATIKGNHFVAGTKPSKVLLCEEFATTLNCKQIAKDKTVVADVMTIEIVTPEHVPGLMDVVVVNPDGQSAVLAQAWFYTPPPKILGVNPPSGTTLGGDVVKLSGQGFQNGAQVTFSATKASSVVVVDGTTIMCKTPPGAPGPAAVTVQNPDLSSHTLGGGFLYIRPPEIGNIFPTMGPEPGGTLVTIQGKGFVPGAGGSKVFFGDVQVKDVDMKVESENLVQAKSPGGVGPVAVKVVNPDGQFAVIGGGFIYIPVIPAPVITKIQPTFGPTGGGYLVTLIGTGFLDGASVAFGKAGTSFAEAFNVKVKNAGTMIVATAPAHPKAVVDVKVTNSDGQFGLLSDGFEFAGPSELPGLAFAGVSPDRGPPEGGYDVVIYGQGFATGVRVFWGRESTAAWMESAKVIRLGPTLLRVTMPAYGKTEKVDVRISNPAFGGLKDEVVGPLCFTFGQSVVLEPKGHRLPVDNRIDDRFAVVFDANGDGMNDVLVLNSGSNDELYINTKDVNGVPGKFIDQSKTNLPATSGERYVPVALDVDNDGDMDIVFRNGNNLGSYRNNGDGTFQWHSHHIGTNIGSAQDIDADDLNCDGVMDLFFSFNGNNVVATGNGLGTFTTAAGVLPSHNEPSRAAALGDVDNDGDPDILIANETAVQNRLYYNNCNNTALPPKCSFQIPEDCSYYLWNGHRYAVCKNSKSWYDAKKSCQQYGWDLLSVNSKAEQDFIQTQLVYHTWFGYDDELEEGKWVAADGTSGFSYWDTSQPNTPSYDCAMMNKDYGYKWDDQYCHNGYDFACEVSTTDQCPIPWGFTDATYGTNKNFPVSGFNSLDAILSDIDADGWLDAVIINNGQTNRIYFNNGGNFLNDDGLHYPQSEANMNDTQGFLIDADLDGDLDLVTMKDYGSSNRWPALFLNDKAQGGAGVYTDATPVNLPAFRGEDSRFLAVGDLNQDGLTDLYIVKEDHQDWLFLNHGWMEDKPMLEEHRVPIGAFANNTFFGVPEDPWHTNAVDIGDIDGDGDLDVVLGNEEGQRDRLWVNDGAGNFFDETNARLPDTSCANRDIAFVDLNEDGDLDIIEACYQYSGSVWGGVRQLVNDGKGYFKDVSAANMPFTYGSGRCHGLGVGDIDGDGDQDVMIGGYRWDYWVLINGGDVYNNDGAYFLNKDDKLETGDVYEGSILLADLNANGHLDAYVALDSGQNQLWYNTGVDGVFKNVTQSHLPAYSDSTRFAVTADVDFDGDMDIFAFNSGENRLMVGELDYKFSDVSVSHLPTGMSADSYGGDVGDLDLDGYPDFFVANWGKQNHLLLNQGDAHFGDFTASVPVDIDYNTFCKFADLDGDGVLDIFLVARDAERIYLNKTPKPKD